MNDDARAKRLVNLLADAEMVMFGWDDAGEGTRGFARHAIECLDRVGELEEALARGDRLDGELTEMASHFVAVREALKEFRLAYQDFCEDNSARRLAHAFDDSGKLLYSLRDLDPETVER